MSMIRLRPIDRYPPGPARSTLAGFAEHDLAYAQCPANLRLRPPELFAYVGTAPDRIPLLCGLTLRPAAAGALRRALADAGWHGVLLSEDQAITALVNTIRTHRHRAGRHEASRMFCRWLAHAFNLGPEIVPLLHRPWVAQEVGLALNKSAGLTTAKAA